MKVSTLKVYMAAVQNIHFDWMSATISAKKASELFSKYRQLHHNRRETVEQRISDFYRLQNEKKCLMPEKASFAPKINPSKKADQEKADRHDKLLEKGEEYKKRKADLLEQKTAREDPEATFKPKVNKRKPKNRDQQPVWKGLY